MIYFYNTFHNGDVHYSRTFVRDMMKKLGDNEYYYLHNNNPDILKDIKNLKQDKVFDSFNNWQLRSKYPITYSNRIHKNGDDIYINTWVGQENWMTLNGLNRNRDMRYCSLYSLYELYQDTYKCLDIKLENIEYYLPEIDFNYVERQNIDIFMSNVNFDYKVLISNNFPRTIRIEIDFDKVVDILSLKYPNVLFILTDKININRKNVFFTSDIINLKSDLIEIGYLSTYCDMIVGRPSGPYCFTMVKDNFNNENKIFLTISNHKYDCFFFESKSDMLWLNNHTTEALIEMIENKINIK
jgi:hypothetical protein